MSSGLKGAGPDGSLGFRLGAVGWAAGGVVFFGPAETEVLEYIHVFSKHTAVDLPNTDTIGQNKSHLISEVSLQEWCSYIYVGKGLCMFRKVFSFQECP